MQSADSQRESQMRRLHRKNRGAHLRGLSGFHSEYSVLERPNKIMNVHWNEAHCGLVVVKVPKCEFYSKNIEKVKKPKDIGTFEKDTRDRTAGNMHAIVPEGETQRYKVRRNSTYQTISQLL